MTRWSPGSNLVAAAIAARPRSPIVRAGGQTARVGTPRCAARFAHLWGRTIEDAALEFGLGADAVRRAWHWLYDDAPAARGDR